MISEYSSELGRADLLVVGAGVAGLSAAIRAKLAKPELEVVVLDKAAGRGNHSLSGAVLEVGALAELLDLAAPGWQESDDAKAILARRVEKDEVLFMPGRNWAMSMMPAIKAAKLFGLGFGQMIHAGDAVVSASELAAWLSRVAEGVGVEVLYGFSVAEILVNASGGARGVRLVDQGLDHEGNPQPNYVKGEVLEANAIVLAEGVSGLVTEQFVREARLGRAREPLYSIGVKELIEVSAEQYGAFTDGRVVHAMGWPIWQPVVGPGMFGGGIMYPFGGNRIAVGMIVGTDWRYTDFNPQDALVAFKEHARVKRYIEGGTVVEAGAKMIPEGGYYAIPRDPQSGAIGQGNVAIVGDSAGMVNMLKIKGLHNALRTGMQAGEAAAACAGDWGQLAADYTRRWEASPVRKEMWSARNFRQTVAKMGPTVGLGLSVLSPVLPKWKVERDWEAMKRGARYKYAGVRPFDKDGFTAKAGVEHREEQPSHCKVLDPRVCMEKCPESYGRPCVTFCPAGVYEVIGGVMKPANPSNCLHCKTCENKCPYDNLRWQAPEGGGGPRYAMM